MMMGQFQSHSGSGLAGSLLGSGSHCYRLMVHVDVYLTARVTIAGGGRMSEFLGAWLNFAV